jgi:hypothetical protein
MKINIISAGRERERERERGEDMQGIDFGEMI